MNVFFEQHWLSILSLVVATVGGVPGILTVINHFRLSAKLVVGSENLILGEIQFFPDPNNYTVIFFSLTITNEGEKNLTPAVFELAIKKGCRWIKLKRSLIPEGAQFLGQEQKIEVREPWKQDLQRYSGTIAYGIPVRGFLFSVTTELTRDELRLMLMLMQPVKFRIVCIDVFNREHKATFVHRGGQVEKSTVYPKHGVSVDVSSDA